MKKHTISNTIIRIIAYSFIAYCLMIIPQLLSLSDKQIALDIFSAFKEGIKIGAGVAGLFMVFTWLAPVFFYLIRSEEDKKYRSNIIFVTLLGNINPGDPLSGKSLGSFTIIRLIPAIIIGVIGLSIATLLNIEKQSADQIILFPTAIFSLIFAILVVIFIWGWRKLSQKYKASGLKHIIFRIAGGILPVFYLVLNTKQIPSLLPSDPIFHNGTLVGTIVIILIAMNMVIFTFIPCWIGFFTGWLIDKFFEFIGSLF